MEIRTEFHKKLKEIQNDVLAMGSMVEKAILSSIQALKDRDLNLAEEIIHNDVGINRKRWEIESKCINIIATQQPMASDLRTIMSVASIITELERIGDYSEGNARIALMIGDQPPLKPLIDLPIMAEKSQDMLRKSLDAFINRDVDAAERIYARDDEIDGLYDQVYRELLSFMIENPKNITRATHLIWAAHNLERSADRVTNICERVIFVVTGKMQTGASKY